MSATIDDDGDDDVLSNGHINDGGAVSDEDVRTMLLQEQRERKRLKAELDQERTSRTRAEATATSHATARFDAEEQVVAERLRGVDEAAKALKKEYSDALSEGRFDEAAEVQDRMAELRAKQQQDRQYQTWLAAEKQRQPQQPPADEVNLADYSPAQRKWIKANPEFMEDAKVRAKTFAGHQLAIAEGIKVDSPEYFEIIDETVNRGKRRRERDDDDDDEPPPRRRETTQDMPVQRRSQQSQERRREIRLSALEREAADITIGLDVPAEGSYSQDGRWIPGRYERYAINREKLKQRGN